MKKMKKALLLVLCAVLLIGATVAGTMAYLTSQDTVVNTFTVGNVAIELHETGEDDFTLNGKEVVGLKDLHLVPGRTVDKDPTVTVKANSEPCYVRMKVTVGNVDSLKAAFNGLTYTGVHGTDLPYEINGMFNLHLLVDGWQAENWAFESYSNGVYEFRYVGTVAKSTADTELPALFTDIVIPGDMTNEGIAELADVTITVVAEAIQAEGFDSADDAWANFPNP